MLAFTLAGFPIKSNVKTSEADTDIHVMMNMHWEALDFEVPTGPGPALVSRHRHAAAVARRHRRPGHEPPFEGGTCTRQGRSIVVLISKP